MQAIDSQSAQCTRMRTSPCLGPNVSEEIARQGQDDRCMWRIKGELTHGSTHGAEDPLNAMRKRFLPGQGVLAAIHGQ